MAFFSCKWVSWCPIKCFFRLKFFPHSKHSNWMKCLVLWVLKESYRLNPFLQISHLKSLSSRWVLRWTCISKYLLNDSPHSGHSKLELWLFRCFFSRYLPLKDFPQNLHSLMANLTCLRTWCRMFLIPGKNFPQTSHSNDLWHLFLLVVGCGNLKVK